MICMNEFCCYCGVNMDHLPKGVTYTKDHLVPKCKGGNDSIENKKACCSNCNSEKGSRTIGQYIVLLEKQLKLMSNYSDFSVVRKLRYELEVKIENAKYIQQYVTTAGLKLYRNKAAVQQWNVKLYNEINRLKINKNNLNKLNVK